MRATPFLALLALGAPLGPLAAAQRTIRVPEDRPTLGAAIGVALDGDTILVAPGRYRENPVVDGRRLTLRSVHGPAVTVIDGGLAGPAASFLNGADGALVGFTLTRGWADYGGGILVQGSSPRIESCRIEGNAANADGGGIWVVGGAPVIVNCVVRENSTVYWDGGGLYLWDAAGAAITNCTVVNNEVSYDGWAGGIWIGGAGVTVSNCIVRDNHAGSMDWDIGLAPGSLVQHTDYGESDGSQGNFDEPPDFVDQVGGDLHLAATSPCCDRGLATAPGLTGRDCDGNPRRVGPGVDVGADELAPCAYIVGRAWPGTAVVVRAVGLEPGGQARVWASLELRDPPLETPWGPWWLLRRRGPLLDASAGASGWVEAPWTVPAGFPAPGVLFLQGRVAGRHTPLAALLVE